MAIPVATLSPGNMLAFDLYIWVNGHYVLYAAAGSPFEIRSFRQDRYNEITTLYAKGNDKGPLRYYEENLRGIVNDKQIPVEAKSKIVYRVATNLVKEILEDPRSGTAIRRSKETVQGMVELILSRQDAFFNLVRITSHDYYTYTHSVNVCTLAVGLAQRLGIGQHADCTLLGLGALLHDVGKCMIDPKILNKPGPLTNEEWVEIRKHPGWGAKLIDRSHDQPPGAEEALGQSEADRLILTASEIPEDALAIIKQHHESCDGQGYPCGLAEKDIHLFAKIVKIADIYDAMTTKRSYKEALSPFAAVKFMDKTFAQAVDRRIFQEFILLLGNGTEGGDPRK